MKYKVFFLIILLLVSFFSGCITKPDSELLVVEFINNQTRSEINSDHTKYFTYNEKEIAGYTSGWKGDLNNIVAIEKDTTSYMIWTCDTDKDSPCEEIKVGDILLVKHSIWHGYEREIIGSILT